MPRTYVLHESGPAGKDGLLTTAARKLEMAALLQTSLLDASLALDAQLFTNSSDGVASLLQMLQTQLLQYRAFKGEDGTNVSAFAPKKIGFSGKCGANGKIVATMQDDMCIALQICMFASAFVIQRKTSFFPHNIILT